MRQLTHPATGDLNLSGVLYALSDPVRLGIVKCLAEKGEQACGVASNIVCKSTASHHFRILREAGIVRMKPNGASYLNSLRADDLEKRFPGLLKTILKHV